MKNSKPLPNSVTLTNKNTGKSITVSKSPVIKMQPGARLAGNPKAASKGSKYA